MGGHMGTVTMRFGDKLKQQLETRNMGVRTLAGQLANGDNGRREVIRRRLNKYIHEGVTPTEPARREIEAALGCSMDELRGDDEDEESSKAMRRAFELFVDLMEEVDAFRLQTRAKAEA